MTRYLAAKLLEVIPVLILASFAVFMLVRLVPGDPALALAGPNATPEQVNQLRAQLGLTGSPLTQYVRWVSQVAHFDFGTSIQYGEPVAQLIRSQLEPTLQLAVAAYLLSVVGGIGLGILAARSRAWNYVANVMAGFAIGFPTFVLGIVLLDLFAAQWRLLPPGGWASVTTDPASAGRRLILPAIALAAITGAVLMRFVRTAMKQVLSEDYVRTARAKGLKERTVIFRHALRNALIPVITVAALQVGRLLGGALIIEIVFARPGLGRLLVDGISARDYPLVQALVLLLVLVFVLVNLAADVMYGVVDPRIRL